VAEKRSRTSAAWSRSPLRAGRPPLPPDERQNAAILVRLLPRELKELRALAADAGMGAGQYAREAVRRHLVRNHGGRSRR